MPTFTLHVLIDLPAERLAAKLRQGLDRAIPEALSSLDS